MAAAAGAGAVLLRGRGRGRRDIGQRNEKIFQEVELLDSNNDCGKLYMCHLATLSEDQLNAKENELIKALKAPKGQIRFESSSAAFESAIELGSRSKNVEVCKKRYFKCV